MNKAGAGQIEKTKTGTENPPESKIPNTFRALKHRNFQLFFAGQFVSLTGTWMQSVAQSWLVYRLTGSVVLLGLIGFASQIPVFLVAPLGGAAADRYNRQKILVLTQSFSMLTAFVLAGLTLTGNIEVWHLFVLGGLFRSGERFRYSDAAGVCHGYGRQGRSFECHRAQFFDV